MSEQEILLELFGKSEKQRNDKDPDVSDKFVIDISEIDKYTKLFDDIVDFAFKTVKNVMPGAKMYPKKDVKKTKKGCYIEYYFYQDIVDFISNYHIIQKVSKNEEIRNNDFNDVDGNDLCEFIEEKILDKFKSKGFSYAEGTYCLMYHTDIEDLSVGTDEGYAGLGIGMTIYAKLSQDDIKELSDTEKSEFKNTSFYGDPASVMMSIKGIEELLFKKLNSKLETHERQATIGRRDRERKPVHRGYIYSGETSIISLPSSKSDELFHQVLGKQYRLIFKKVQSHYLHNYKFISIILDGNTVKLKYKFASKK